MCLRSRSRSSPQLTSTQSAHQVQNTICTFHAGRCPLTAKGMYIGRRGNGKRQVGGVWSLPKESTATLTAAAGTVNFEDDVVRMIASSRSLA